jgi:hypothetical protein
MIATTAKSISSAFLDLFSLLLGQTVEVSDIEFTLSSFRLFMNILFEETITILFTIHG